MEIKVRNKNYLGINGLGRIGKLVLWHQLAKKSFDGVVINLGRKVGKDLDDLIQTIESDTTYGPLGKFLHGINRTGSIVKVIDKDKLILEIEGMPVKILTQERNPKNIQWKNEDVRIVVDCTGQYVDPTAPFDDAKGSLRGHLIGGAQKVILSAPFKIKDKSSKMPEDSSMMVYGINHLEYNPEKHHVISAASCTTTGLSHMIKPLLEDRETSKILTTSMSTVHASTNTQTVLDSVPKEGASDLRKTRSVLNNIILSTTGAAKALESILPQIQEIGFMADSVRIPTSTVSLLILNITFSAGLDGKGNPIINRKYLNDIYAKAAAGSQKDLLVFSERQNVSSDLMGYKASVVIEGHETHTRTGFINIPAEMLESYGMKDLKTIQLPVTHAKLFGWYDNEYGSYVNTLSALADYINKKF
jgi:glyceraldehyde 3-phosphate dehydrogenase